MKIIFARGQVADIHISLGDNGVGGSAASVNHSSAVVEGIERECFHFVRECVGEEHVVVVAEVDAFVCGAVVAHIVHHAARRQQQCGGESRSKLAKDAAEAGKHFSVHCL